MTVSYTGDVANASGFGCFNKILLKWKGSVYKLIYKVMTSLMIKLRNNVRILQELLAYLAIYLMLNIVYRNILIPRSSQTECVETDCGSQQWVRPGQTRTRWTEVCLYFSGDNLGRHSRAW